MQRRQFLGGTAAVGGAALAGQVGGTDADINVRSGDGPQTPSVPVGEADGGWAVDRERSGTFTKSSMGVTSIGTTIVYRDEGLSETLQQRTMGTGFEDLRMFFATRIKYSPGVDRLPFGVGRSVVVDRTESNARDSFQQRLEEAGLDDIERREVRRIDVADGPTTDLLLYDAVYPYDGFEFDAGDSVVSVEDEPVGVEGLLAVWYDRDGSATLVAGAVNPAENYEKRIERQVTEAVDLTLDIDLGLTPKAYRQESLDLIRSVN